MLPCKYSLAWIVLAASLCFASGGKAQADGTIYAIAPDNDLMWYRHDGRNDGTFRWAFNEGKKVGVGWSFKQVFSGSALAR